MLHIRKSEDRGAFRIGWLDSKHSFSFGEYHDPAFMGFRSLRVINEDKVKPGAGFDTHGHRDMEIISYVLEGAIEHRDSLGTGSVITPGDVQIMSAGTGIRHSEFNPSATAPLHFLQIWILPERAGLAPRYDQRTFARERKLNRLCLVGSHDGREESVRISQDVDLYASVLEPGATVGLKTQPGRGIWLQVVAGSAAVNGEAVTQGDGMAIDGVSGIEVIGGAKGAEILLFDLA